MLITRQQINPNCPATGYPLKKPTKATLGSSHSVPPALRRARPSAVTGPSGAAMAASGAAMAAASAVWLGGDAVRRRGLSGAGRRGRSDRAEPCRVPLQVEWVLCPYDVHHRVPRASLERHAASCRLRRMGYSAEEEVGARLGKRGTGLALLPRARRLPPLGGPGP